MSPGVREPTAPRALQSVEDVGLTPSDLRVVAPITAAPTSDARPRWSLEDAPDATIVVESSGRIAFANARAAALFGTVGLVGTSVDGLLPERSRMAHRASRIRFLAAPATRIMGADLDVWAHRADGSEFPAQISLSSRQVGDEHFTVASIRDCSDQAVADDHHRRVLQMLDASDDAIFIFDATTLAYSYVNDGAVRLVGYSREELLAMTPLHLNPYDSQTDYQDLVGGLLANGTASVLRPATLLRKDGTEVVVEKTLRSAPIGGDGVHSVIAMARDITARKAAEGQLRHSQGALATAERVLASDRERIARDLHDTVIQRLFGEGLNLQAALGSFGDDDATRDRLQSTIDGLDQTIKELRMAIFALEDDGLSPGGVRGRLLEEVTFAANGLGFYPRLEFDGPIESMADEVVDQLTSVLREALSNVAHHARASNVGVAIRFADRITLTVTDDGVGLPDGYVAGLGLANLAQRAQDLHGVSTVVAQPAGGTVLIWQVPSAG